MNELRFALRRLLKNPGFTGVAVLTLALGIGVNSALFSILYAVLLEPLPYPESDRLVQVQSTISSGPDTQTIPFWSYPRFELLRDSNQIFSGVAAFANQTVIVTGTESAERVDAELTSAGYFPLLGVRAKEGRVFLPEEDRKGGGQPVVMLGYSYWQRRFGGNPGAIGQILRVNDIPLTIIGVLPAEFKGQSGGTELWIPITLAPVLEGDASRLDRPFTMWHRVLARLRPPTGLSAAKANLGSLERQLESALPVSSEKERYGIALVPFREAATDPKIRQSLWLLAAAVGFVLLICCVNVASLQLARAVASQRELATRLALGATRGRLTSQLLAESLVLAVLAGIAGLVFARWAVNVMSNIQPTVHPDLHGEFVRLPEFGTIHLGVPILVFNFSIALGCGLVSGLFPAWRATRRALSPLLHRSDAPVGAHQTLGLGGARGLLVVAETALALMLLAGAGLMTRSFARLATTRLGFAPKHLLAFRLDQPRGATEASSQLFFQQILERVSAIPDVESACLANATPLSSSFDRSFMMVRAGANQASPAEAFIGVHLASSDYLRTLQVPLVRGRWLTEQDRQGTPLVAVVNEAAARKYWPGGDPVGQQVDLQPALGPGFPNVTVVGIIGNVKYDQMAAEMGPNVYLSYRQSGYPGYYITLRTRGEPLALAGAVRVVVTGVNASVPIYDLGTMDQRIASSTSRDRFNTLLLLAFSILAVVLAAVGIYGVVAYSVSQRTREIGIRIALGAEVADVFRLIVGQGMRLVLTGTLIGLAGAMALTHFLRSLLFSVSATDPLTFAAVSVVLAGVAFFACWVPARRAIKVDPVEALRHE